MVSQVKLKELSPQDEVDALGKVQCLLVTFCVHILHKQKRQEDAAISRPPLILLTSHVRN